MIPPYLQKGDTIGITAPAHKISGEDVEPAVNFLEKNGFKVKLADHLFASHHQYAGTDIERTEDFQAMIDDPAVKAILCARGGYGSVRIIDRLDFSGFKTRPKWICGYSDVTVFHSHIYRNYGISTLHCTMPVNFKTECSVEENAGSMIEALMGKTLVYHTAPHPFNIKGKTEGKLIGGNLSILYSLLGSSSDIDTDNCILFLEDLDEYLYHIDRMMMNMKRTGKLDKLAGLVIGGMSQMHDNKIPYGSNAEEIITQYCSESDIPVCFGFPSGHESRNLALRLGQKAVLTVNETGELLMES